MSIKTDCEAIVALGRKPTIPEVAPLVAAYMADGNEAGGSLHIVLDDRSVDDASVRFCETYARDIGDADGESLARVLLLMSKTQRLKLGGG